AEGAEFDGDGLRDFLAAQPDLGTKSAPRFVRVSRHLPTTGSNKVRKNLLQAQAWDCADPVHRWTGRGAPEYRPMTEADREALRAEFTAHGRQRFLPA
ncbi:acyl-CoA synthetase, partial [Streptomyces sp. NPDC059506]